MYSGTFFLHTFFLIKILKTNVNVIPCDKDVNKKYLKHTYSSHLFWHKRKLMWLGHELGCWISKLSDRPTRRWKLDDKHLIVHTKFNTSDDNGRWSSSLQWEPSLKARVSSLSTINNVLAVTHISTLRNSCYS